MRTDPFLYTQVNAAIQDTQQALSTSIAQLSSGKRVSLPSDDTTSFVENVQSTAISANVDRYTKNAETVLSQVQAADSALSTVVASLTKALSLGTDGADGSVSSGQRADIASQVLALTQEVVSQANTTYGGAALFAGTASTTTPFVEDTTSATGFTYQGNSGTNKAQVGEALTANINVPGDTIFASTQGSVLGSLAQLTQALQSGSTYEIADATSAIKIAITHVGDMRVTYGSVANRLEAQQNYLSQESVSLSSQQNALTGIDIAKAATNLTQAQTAHSAVLAMAAKILPTSLLDYLK